MKLTLEQIAKRNAYTREWKKRNPDKVRIQRQRERENGVRRRANRKYYDANKELIRNRQQDFRRTNRERLQTELRAFRAKPEGKAQSRNNWLRQTYGISLEEYNVIFDTQGGVCLVCHRPETRQRDGVVLPLVVDHNHETGQIRGLLCHACNVSLGLLNENPDRMRALATYIETKNTRRSEG